MRWEIAKRELKESAKGEERELSEQIHSEILITILYNVDALNSENCVCLNV